MSSSFSLAARNIGLRRYSTLLSTSSRVSPSSYLVPCCSSQLDTLSLQQRRWKSKDVGDVIGIDLGTTNSCVAIMVRFKDQSVAISEDETMVFIGSILIIFLLLSVVTAPYYPLLYCLHRMAETPVS